MDEDSSSVTQPQVNQSPILRFWNVFHNFIIVGIVFTLVGVAVGVKVSKDFYVSKLDELISTGAMLHKAKVYTINPKL